MTFKQGLSFISLMLYLSVCNARLDCPPACVCEGSKMVCQRKTLPEWIPYGTDNVTLYDMNLTEVFPYRRWSNGPMYSKFDNGQWGNVTYLDISAISKNERPPTPVSLYLNNVSFTGLHKLNYLGIHTGQSICTLGVQAFAAIDGLTALDLSRSTWVSFSNIHDALISTREYPILPSLQNFVLTRSAFYFDTHPDYTSLEALWSGRFIKYIELSDLTIGTFDFRSIQVLCHTLVKAKLQRITLGHSKNVRRAGPCKSLKYVDLTGSRDSNMDIYEQFLIDCSSLSVFDYVENLIVDKCLSRPPRWFTDLWSLNLTRCFYRLRAVSLRGNNLQHLNMSVVLPQHMKDNFEELDISENQLKYISPAIFRQWPNMKILNLSDNLLHIMQREHKYEFGELFKTFSHLETLYLANNHLTDLPTNMLLHNMRLTYIDMSYNKLNTLNLNLKHMCRLEFLNLRGNTIQILSPATQNNFDVMNAEIVSNCNISISEMYVKNVHNRTYRPQFHVNLSQNKFMCNCEHNSFKFLEWVRDSQSVFRTNETIYNCTLEDERSNDILTTTIALTEALEWCSRQRLMQSLLIAGVVVLVMFVSIIVATVCVKRRSRKRKKLNETLLQLKEGKFQKKFLVFLSFCSEDADFVFENIYNQLQQEFCGMMKSNRDYVCFGDRHFRPGFPIHTEVASCLEESAVALFIVSEAFCKKGWCQMEVGEAYDQGKPIIMLMREHVENDVMPKFLRKIFDRYTRALWVLDGNVGHIEPTWHTLCTSVIELAGQGDRFDRLK